MYSAPGPLSLNVLHRLPGTMWQGLEPDECPDQGVSPLPFLSLTELLAFSARAWAQVHASISVAASLPARSGEAARTDSLPATAAPQQTEEKTAAFDLGFSDLRRCSTADQSGLPDFEDFHDGH